MTDIWQYLMYKRSFLKLNLHVFVNASLTLKITLRDYAMHGMYLLVEPLTKLFVNSLTTEAINQYQKRWLSMVSYPNSLVSLQSAGLRENGDAHDGRGSHSRCHQPWFVKGILTFQWQISLVKMKSFGLDDGVVRCIPQAIHSGTIPMYRAPW